MAGILLQARRHESWCQLFSVFTNWLVANDSSPQILVFNPLSSIGLTGIRILHVVKLSGGGWCSGGFVWSKCASQNVSCPPYFQTVARTQREKTLWGTSHEIKDAWGQGIILHHHQSANRSVHTLAWDTHPTSNLSRPSLCRDTFSAVHVLYGCFFWLFHQNLSRSCGYHNYKTFWLDSSSVRKDIGLTTLLVYRMDLKFTFICSFSLNCHKQKAFFVSLPDI